MSVFHFKNVIFHTSISLAVERLPRHPFSFLIILSEVKGLISPSLRAPSLPPIMNPLSPTSDLTFPSPSKGSNVHNSLHPNEGPNDESKYIPPCL